MRCVLHACAPHFVHWFPALLRCGHKTRCLCFLEGPGCVSFSSSSWTWSWSCRTRLVQTVLWANGSSLLWPGLRWSGWDYLSSNSRQRQIYLPVSLLGHCCIDCTACLIVPQAFCWFALWPEHACLDQQPQVDPQLLHNKSFHSLADLLPCRFVKNRISCRVFSENKKVKCTLRVTDPGKCNISWPWGQDRRR